MRPGYFVFEKDSTHPPLYLFEFTAGPLTRSKLKEYLNTRLNDGFEAEDFLIIRGREEKITAVKVVAELETVES